jgi:amino acid transporter
VAIGVMSAFLTSINGSILMTSRMLFVLSEDRRLPPFLAAILFFGEQGCQYRTGKSKRKDEMKYKRL